MPFLSRSTSHEITTVNSGPELFTVSVNETATYCRDSRLRNTTRNLQQFTRVMNNNYHLPLSTISEMGNLWSPGGTQHERSIYAVSLQTLSHGFINLYSNFSIKITYHFENPILCANLTALSFIEPELWAIEVYAV